MTADDIRIFQKEQFGATKGNDPLGFCLAEIALQLALLNEHNARMEARYMALTAKAAGNQKGKVVRKPTTVKFKTKSGKPVSMKALKTEIQNS
jgi:hypothetical protein